jgi:hypothetical protein
MNVLELANKLGDLMLAQPESKDWVVSLSTREDDGVLSDVIHCHWPTHNELILSSRPYGHSMHWEIL